MQRQFNISYGKKLKDLGISPSRTQETKTKQSAQAWLKENEGATKAYNSRTVIEIQSRDRQGAFDTLFKALNFTSLFVSSISLTLAYARGSDKLFSLNRIALHFHHNFPRNLP